MLAIGLWDSPKCHAKSQALRPRKAASLQNRLLDPSGKSRRINAIGVVHGQRNNDQRLGQYRYGRRRHDTTLLQIVEERESEASPKGWHALLAEPLYFHAGGQG
jgi:hypothetical protein